MEKETLGVKPHDLTVLRIYFNIVILHTPDKIFTPNSMRWQYLQRLDLACSLLQ